MKRGKWLRTVRTFLGLSQSQVAEAYGAEQSTISRIESDDVYVTLEMEVRYIEACGGPKVLKTILSGVQNLLDRWDVNHLLPA